MLRLVGVDVVRYAPQSSDAARIAKLLSNYHVDCVFDVGANIGQYAEELRAIGYRGRIVSFEPQAEAHAKLIRNSLHDPQWDVAPRMALGDVDGDAELNLAGNSASSSILKMSAAHVAAAPHSRYVGKESISLQRLDSIFHEYIGNAKRPFLKIDTQGYESQVLDGAMESLEHFIGVQTEMSLVELYENQMLFFDMAQRLRNNGFELAGLLPGFVDNDSGHLLQVDGMFFRNNE